MKTLISFYTFKLPIFFVYMSQQVDYRPKKFISWILAVLTENKKISLVIYRKELIYTKKAYALILGLYVFAFAFVLYPFFLYENISFVFLNLTINLLLFPILLFLLVLAFTFLARVLIVAPKEKRMINRSKSTFAEHPGVKVAILGSYGKTSMKELLGTILSESMNVAVTPGNMNTAVSHARFAQKLTGKEDVLIVEFGEGEPGDIAIMADNFSPDYAIVTGLAPNHLDQYTSLDEVAKDLLSIYDYVEKDRVFLSSESDLMNKYMPKYAFNFNNTDVLGWKINDILVSVTETSFKMKKNKKELSITTSLIGRHQVAPMAFAVAFAEMLRVNEKEIFAGISKIRPYKHRMQPRRLHGAWLIDDTYNGNIEGMKAGLKLLGELDMKRKWYVTPGLVDQGEETKNVHEELGRTIAGINPDIVVLMENSVRPLIQKSMKKNGYSGEIRIENNPLEFYTNIEHVIVPGDLMILQNDWTDNYN